MANKPKSSPSVYNLMMREGETPEAYYRRLAKVADQRLVRLEKLSAEKGYKGVKSYSYANAMHDIQIFNPGAKRFNTKLRTYETPSGEVKLDQRELRERTMSVLDFLQAPTSTKTGIDTKFKMTVDTINKKYGTSFTWQEAASFFSSKTFEGQFKRAGGSPVALRAIGVIKKLDVALKSGMTESLDFKLDGPVKGAAIRLLSDRRRKYIGGREYTADAKEAIINLLNAYER